MKVDGDRLRLSASDVANFLACRSSAEEASRGLEFLYDPHRLNVATSHAKVMAIIVASPCLVQGHAGLRGRWPR